MYKEKEGLLPWILKFAPRKKVGMLLLCAVSLAVLVWVLFVDKACPVCYLPVEQAIALMPDSPSFSPEISNLTYIREENLRKTEFGGSEFGGYPSLMQRNDSYDVRESMNVHCGFVRGIRPGHQTGFDIDDSDLLGMESCGGVVVASAIFGAFDLIRQPKNIGDMPRKMSASTCSWMKKQKSL